MPTVTYLVGPPASGKRTIGRQLSGLTGAVLVDNHLINGPVFAAYGADGTTRLPAWIWKLTNQVREATIVAASRAAPTTSHIFTNYLSADKAEEEFVDQLRGLAAERRAQFVPVWLTCPEEELLRRVVSADRAQWQKLRDPDALRRVLRTRGVLRPQVGALTLDTSRMSPLEAARRIAERTQGA